MENERIKNECYKNQNYFKKIGTFVTTSDGVTKFSTLNPYSNEFYPRHKLMAYAGKPPTFSNNYRWPSYRNKKFYKNNYEKYPISMVSSSNMPRKFSLEYIQESSEELAKEEHTENTVEETVVNLFSNQKSFNDRCYESVMEIKKINHTINEFNSSLKSNPSNLQCEVNCQNNRVNLNLSNKSSAQSRDKSSTQSRDISTENCILKSANNSKESVKFKDCGSFTNKVDKVGDVPKISEQVKASELSLGRASVKKDLTSKKVPDQPTNCVLKKNSSTSDKKVKKHLSPMTRRVKVNGTTLWSTLRRTSTLSLNSLKSINNKICRGRFLEPVIRHTTGRVPVESKPKSVTRNKVEQKPSASVSTIHSQNNNYSAHKSKQEAPSSSKNNVLTKEKVRANGNAVHATSPLIKKREIPTKRFSAIKRTI